MTFTDDFSMKIWIYFLKNKSDACDVFKSFKAYVEKQSGHLVKITKNDSSTEFIVSNNFLERYNIKQELFVFSFLFFISSALSFPE